MSFGLKTLKKDELSYFFAMQAKQQGSLGVAFDVIWFEPKTNSTEDIEATQRAQDFQLGW